MTERERLTEELRRVMASPVWAGCEEAWLELYAKAFRRIGAKAASPHSPEE